MADFDWSVAAFNLGIYLALCVGLVVLLMLWARVPLRPVRVAFFTAMVTVGFFGDLLVKLGDQHDGGLFVLASIAMGLLYIGVIVTRARMRRARLAAKVGSDG